MIKTQALRLFNWLLNRYTDRFSDRQFVDFLLGLISRRIAGNPPARALRVLFSLDAVLYGMQGQSSIAYDGGIHTKHRHMKYHDFFTRRIGEADRVLDIGCGNGAVAYDVAQIAKEVVGIDINADNIAAARRQYRHPHLEFRLGDALEALPDEKFSVIILSNVLEHLPGRPAFLRRLQATLRPERILIRVPLFERDWRVPLKKELGLEWRLDNTHEIEYTLETFTEEMAEAGLESNHLEVRWGEIWAEVTGSKQ
ncbi:MAG: class I SAM-dependent methyltransferase [Chloroflexi bacterium]|nr:class I SAM-dependent methyltransferase [Chloroflexota bacterium]